MASSSDDSDSPLVDNESGLPILLLGSDDPVPKHSYENVVRIDASRKRPRTCRRRMIGVDPLTVEGNSKKARNLLLPCRFNLGETRWLRIQLQRIEMLLAILITQSMVPMTVANEVENWGGGVTLAKHC